LQEITYHRVYEDGVEVSNGIVKTVVLKAAIPEIVMVGSQSSFASVAIPGRIAYLSGGNAWIIEDKTSERQLIVSTGDLDGRIFSLSHDGKLLLFTRFTTTSQTINTLWMAILQSDPVKIIDLGIDNVVLFAQFSPDSKYLAYSTAEWRETSPGWQANNDLWEAVVGTTGIVGTPQQMLSSNSGGVYGWWGTEFSYSADGKNFLYARPDSIGIIDRAEGEQTPIIKITPYQTGGNWAWVPGASLSYDQDVIYTLDNATSDTNGQQFNLVAIPLLGGSPVHLVQNVGMFAYPVLSPPHAQSGVPGDSSSHQVDQGNFSVAYLQAVFPDQSETSQYRLSLMDRDGSNQISLYPAEGMPGLAPQHVVWSPSPMGEGNDYTLGFVYQGNIWLIDTVSGAVQQITGDGLTSRLDWR
jgi:resuscitation-promoting factor RpfB